MSVRLYEPVDLDPAALAARKARAGTTVSVCLPARNEEGYKASSPVHAAAQLNGKLMLVHNFQDDNVLFQNSQNMMEALQRAGKQFESMFYPLKSHGVTGPLRLHMLQTITGFFDRNLKTR